METTAQPIDNGQPDAPSRPGLSTETKTLLYVLGAALFLRIILAMVFPGHPTDINNFKAWAMHWVKVGPSNFFLGPQKTWCDYPPAYVYVIGITAWLYHLLDPNFTSWATPFFTLAIKLPALLAEIGCGWFIFKIVRRHASFGIALTGTAIYLFNPATNYDTAIAGQMNPVIGLIQLASIWLLIQRRHAWAILLTAVAILIKPQGLIIGPFIAIIALLRKDFKGILLGCVGGLAAAFLLTAVYVVPHLGVGGVFPWLYQHYQEQANLYPFSSIQAFNLWSLTGMWQPDSRTIFGISHQHWGLVLFAIAYAAILANWWRRRDDDIALIQAAALVMTAFFLLPTRMHERYLHYTLILMMVPAILSVRWRWPLAIFSGTFLINVAYELKFPESIKPMMDWLATGSYKSLSLLNLGTFAYCCYLAFRSPTVELQEPQPESDSATAPKGWREILYAVIERRGFQMSAPVGLDRRDWIGVLSLTAVSTIIRLYNLAWPPQMIFDEVYHARTANEYLFSVRPTEWVHPPVAKLLILIGVQLNGMTSFGWRIVPCLAGSLLLPVFYLLAKNVIGDRRWALVATAILSMDGVYFVQSRTAMTNIFAILFQVATMTAFWLYWKSSSRERPLQHKWLFATGVCLSLALSTRWTSLWTFGTIWLLLGVRYLLPEVWRTGTPQPKSVTVTEVSGASPLPDTTFTEPGSESGITATDVLQQFRAFRTLTDIPFLVLSGVMGVLALLGLRFLTPDRWRKTVQEVKGAVAARAVATTPAEPAVENAAPPSPLTAPIAATEENIGGWHWRLPRFHVGFWACAVLYLFLLPLVVYAISYIPYKNQGHTWSEIFWMQKDIWHYHANLRDPHPYYSAWYSWPFLYRPTWYYFKGLADGTVAGIDAIGNPAIWWASLIGVGWTLWAALIRRKADWLFAVVAFVFMYLPWAVTPRVLNYSHYYFEAIPYAILAITLLVRDLWESNHVDRWIAISYLAAVVGLFIFFYPIWAGTPIPNWYFYMHIWFPKWV